MKYIIKCDNCKRTIRKTDNITESYAGGQCSKCRNNWLLEAKNKY